MGIIFRNGVAYGGTAEIDAEENQLLVGDGLGWTIGSSFYAKDEQEEDEVVLSKVVSPTPTVQFGSEVEGEDQNYYKASDTAKMEINGKSSVQIGNTGEDYTQIGRQFYGVDLISPSVKMEGCSLFQMIQDPSHIMRGQVFSMIGDGFIDLGAEPSVSTVQRDSGLAKLARGAYNAYSNIYTPWGSGRSGYIGSDPPFPWVHIHHSSTILMDGAPLINMKDGAALTMGGTADVLVMGSYQSPTAVDLNEGSYVKMCGKPVEYGQSAIVVENDSPQGANQQIIISTCFHPDSFRSSSTSSSGWNSLANNIFYYHINGPMGWPGGSKFYPFERSKVKQAWDTNKLTGDLTSHTKGASLLIQGRSSVVIGNKGFVGIRIGAESNGFFSLDATSETGSLNDIKFGCAAGSLNCVDINIHGTNLFEYAPDGDANTTFAIEPHGMTSIKFSPTECFGLSITPENTDIVCQWKAFNGILDGKNVFIQNEGNTHIELLTDSTFIMRGPTEARTDFVSGEHPKNYSNEAYGDGSLRFETSQDYTNRTYEDLTNSDKNAFYEALNTNFKTNRRYKSGGTFTSSPKEGKEKKYKTKIQYATQEKASSCSTSVYNFSWYPYSKVQLSLNEVLQAPGFINTYKSIYGNDTIISNAEMYMQVYSSGYCRYYISADIENIVKEFYSETGYPIGTTFNNLSEADKTSLLLTTNTNSEDHSGKGYQYTSSNSTIVSSEIRPDMEYITSASGFQYYDGTHLGEDWSLPIQNILRSEDNTQGPVFQLYDNSNLCMRDSEAYPTIYQYTLTSPVGTYDPSTQSEYEIVQEFENCADYTTFTSGITIPTGKELSSIIDVDASVSGQLTISYTLKPVGKENHVVRQTGDTSPIFEMTDASELRLYGGAKITAETKYDTTFITFSSENSNEEVTFSIAELQELKRLIST